MPSLVQLHEKYGDQGFVILAITPSDSLKAVEDRSEREGWGINYRVIRDQSRSIVGRYGVSGYPTTYLVDPDGVVIGTHIPGESEIENLLKKVKMFAKPADLPKSLSKAEKYFDGKAYGRAWKEITKVLGKADEEDEKAKAEEFLAVVDGIAENQLKRADRAVEKKDFIRAMKTLQGMEASFDKSDHADAAEEKLEQLEDDYPTAIEGTELYLKLEAAVAAKKRDKDKQKMAGAFRQLAAKYKGTPLAEQCNRRAKELQDL